MYGPSFLYFYFGLGGLTFLFVRLFVSHRPVGIAAVGREKVRSRFFVLLRGRKSGIFFVLLREKKTGPSFLCIRARTCVTPAGRIHTAARRVRAYSQVSQCVGKKNRLVGWKMPSFFRSITFLTYKSPTF